MFEFHGWATIRFTPDNLDRADEDLLQSAAVANVNRYIEQMHWAPESNLEVRVRFMNGKTFLWAAGMKNHRGQIGRDLLALFEFIGQAAPGSYGLLYVVDDEHYPGSFKSYDDGQDYHNAFQVFVLARGVLKQHADPFLSPFQPVVEDPAPE